MPSSVQKHSTKDEANNENSRNDTHNNADCVFTLPFAGPGGVTVHSRVARHTPEAHNSTNYSQYLFQSDNVFIIPAISFISYIIYVSLKLCFIICRKRTQFFLL